MLRRWRLYLLDGDSRLPAGPLPCAHRSLGSDNRLHPGAAVAQCRADHQAVLVQPSRASLSFDLPSIGVITPNLYWAAWKA